MSLLELHHISIRTHDLEATRDFFVEILGMTEGDRPPFQFPGYWLYVGGQPVVHLIGIDREDNSGLTNYLGSKRGAVEDGTGAFDHVAFNINAPETLIARLKARGIAYRERQVPDTNLLQIFVEDPNGILVELNYHA